jgi:hypothetical protein
MTPQLDVIWSRGWYNALAPPPPTVPLDYYNRRSLTGEPEEWQDVLESYFPPTLCGPRWMRSVDVSWWMAAVLPHVRCNFILITSDSIRTVPLDIPNSDLLLDNPYLEAWYAQNVAVTNNLSSDYPKLYPLSTGVAAAFWV